MSITTGYSQALVRMEAQGWSRNRPSWRAPSSTLWIRRSPSPDLARSHRPLAAATLVRCRHPWSEHLRVARRIRRRDPRSGSAADQTRAAREADADLASGLVDVDCDRSGFPGGPPLGAFGRLDELVKLGRLRSSPGSSMKRRATTLATHSAVRHEPSRSRRYSTTLNTSRRPSITSGARRACMSRI